VGGLIGNRPGVVRESGSKVDHNCVDLG